MVFRVVFIVLAVINCIWDFTDENADIWHKVAGVPLVVLWCVFFVSDWRSYRCWKKAGDDKETAGADGPEM